MRQKNIVAAILGVALLAGSCGNINDDLVECPPEGAVVVAIKDKNYENVREVRAEEELDENMPMPSYIHSLITWNHNLDMDDYEVYDETMDAGELTHTLSSAYFADGVNEVTVIGNENIYARNFSKSSSAMELHPEGREYTDIYMGTADIYVPLAEEQTVWMSRTKGKLIVEMVGMPAGARSVDISVGNLYGAASVSAPSENPVGYDILYSGSATVAKSFDTTAPGSVFEILLSPSRAPENTSPVMIDIDHGNVRTSLSFNTTIVRNRITLVRPEYDPDTGSWQIMVMVDGEWKKVENMDLE